MERRNLECIIGLDLERNQQYCGVWFSMLGLSCWIDLLGVIRSLGDAFTNDEAPYHIYILVMQLS